MERKSTYTLELNLEAWDQEREVIGFVRVVLGLAFYFVHCKACLICMNVSTMIILLTHVCVRSQRKRIFAGL